MRSADRAERAAEGSGRTPTSGADRGYIDVNALVGPKVGRASGAAPELLRRERQTHGIRFSLVHSRSALLDDARFGNEQMLEACQDDPGLVPVAVLAAERTEGLSATPSPGSRVAAFWLEGRATPGRSSIAADVLANAAAKAGKPLFVPITRYGDASMIGAATAGLGVPVVLVGTHYDNVVDTLAAAQRFPHLHIETSSMAHLGAIEIAVGAIGAERVLLGTGSPLRAIQSSLNAIALARIPDDAKRAILAGNAARLFGLRAAPVDVPELKRPERAIDTHTHTGRLPADVTDLRDEDLLAELARQTGTRIAIASNAPAISADLEAGNRRTVEVCRSNPGLLGYLVADPNDLDTAREQIRRWGDAPGIVGIKIGCEQSQHTASPAIWDLFTILADYGRPVKIHNDGPGWDTALLRIAQAHPRLPIIIAHGGLGNPSLEGAALTEAADNVYLEMSSSFARLDTAREVARRVPAHKFMFGTDAPLLEPGFVLGTYQDAETPPARQDAVYFDNAARLFGLASAPT